MELNQLTRTDQIGAGDLLAVFGQSTSSTRAVPVSALLTLFQSTLSANGGFVSQYAAPNVNGATVTYQPPTDGANMFLMLTPPMAIGTLNVVLPSLPVDGQEILFTTTQAITTLAVMPNGSTVIGAPTSLTAGGFFRLRYDGVLKTYFRIG